MIWREGGRGEGERVGGGKEREKGGLREVKRDCKMEGKTEFSMPSCIHGYTYIHIPTHFFC